MAHKYLLPSADQGEAVSQACVGWMYSMGEGVPQDDQMAFKYFELSANQGDRNGQFGLGCLYFNDTTEVLPDRQMACSYFRTSADQGNPHAQALLERLYPYNQNLISNRTKGGIKGG
jgi:uncharacterized protein